LQHNASCAACLATQDKLATAANQSSKTVECIHGLFETVVPINVGGQVIGFIRTGQVFGRTPTAAGLKRVIKWLAKWNVPLSAASVRTAYFATKVVPLSRYRSMVGLLEVMAQHLAVISNRLLLQKVHAEPPVIAYAREYIEAHHDEPLTLQRVAEAVHTNRFRLCKLFKAATGLHFTNYVVRLRVEKAKNLLLNPHYSISEIAFNAGFQSLVHFNRSFKKVAGCNPTAYRAQLDTCRRGGTSGDPTRLNSARSGAAIEFFSPHGRLNNGGSHGWSSQFARIRHGNEISFPVTNSEVTVVEKKTERN
jgi:AraC-like DNA-binding protein